MSVTDNPTKSENIISDASLGGAPPRAGAGQNATTGERILHIVNSGVVAAIVVLISLIWSVPTFGLFVSSFRLPADINTTGWWMGLVPPWHFTIENYTQVLQAQGLGQAFLNSLIIAIPGTLIPVLVAAFAAYSFAWMKFPFRDWIFLAFVAHG